MALRMAIPYIISDVWLLYIFNQVKWNQVQFTRLTTRGHYCLKWPKDQKKMRICAIFLELCLHLNWATFGRWINVFCDVIQYNLQRCFHDKHKTSSVLWQVHWAYHQLSARCNGLRAIVAVLRVSWIFLLWVLACVRAFLNSQIHHGGLEDMLEYTFLQATKVFLFIQSQPLFFKTAACNSFRPLMADFMKLLC